MSFHCLECMPRDYQKVVSMFCQAVERLGEEKAISFFENMTSKRIKFIDVINSVERELACGKQAGEVKSTLKISKHRGNGSGRNRRYTL